MSETVTQLRVQSETVEQVAGVFVAVVVGTNHDGRPLVRWGMQMHKPRPARVIWMEAPPDWVACKGLQVVIGIEDGEEAEPIILGFLDSPPKADEGNADPSSAVGPAKDAKPKTLRIESEQELVLECGKARIALRADGRVVILGGYVLSRSRGVNKIKGGSVQIN